MTTLKGLAVATFVFVSTAAGTARAEQFVWPMSGSLSSTHRYTNGAYHDGSADIAAPYWRGIGAARWGRAYPWRDYYGANGVTIYHTGGYTTVYGHFVRWANVWSGQWVNQNQHIAYNGSTGWSTGPHLHFAIRRWGTRQIIPSIWFWKWVNRGWGIPGWYAL